MRQLTRSVLLVLTTDEKGSCSRFQDPQKGQKFGFWASKKLKMVQKICRLVIFDILS